MRKVMIISFLAMVAVCFAVSPVSAVKPGKDVNPNGFPAGTHWNMNMIGKKANFTCPVQENYLRVTVDENGDGDEDALVETCDEGDTCAETDVPIYGNVVFIPEKGDGIEIYMRSPKGNDPVSELQVRDACAGFDGDPAEVLLPELNEGCRVFARALAKPTDMPKIWTSPQFEMIQDDNGNTLIYLGDLGGTGFKTKDNKDYLQRKKGKSVGEEISYLLQWSGNICSLEEADDLTPTNVCALDADNDGVLDTFRMPEEGGGCPNDDQNWVITTLYCNYYDQEWIFNIPTLSEYLWNVNNEGMKLLQIRFYPNGN